MTPQPVCQTATFGFQRRNNYYKRDKQRERLGGGEGIRTTGATSYRSVDPAVGRCGALPGTPAFGTV
jgi:hypothetical protein